MNNYTANNLLLFRKYFNRIYHVVRNKERNTNKYRIVNTRSGYPTLEVNSDESGLIFMHSKYDPVNEATQWLNKMEEQIGEASHLLLFGIGLGYQVEQLIMRYPERKIYIIEPEIEHILAAMEARDLSLLLKHRNISLIAVGKDDSIYKQAVDAMSKYMEGSFYALYPPFYIKHVSDEVKHFITMFRESLNSERINIHTHITFKTDWIVNNLMNIPSTLFSRNVWPLRDRFEDCPMIVVGSGPSLDHNIEYLRELQHHIPIIAAGTSTQALLAAGIRPHMIVSMDGGEPNYQAFYDLDTSGIPFVNSPMINYKILQEVPKEDLYHVFLSSDIFMKYLFNVSDETKKIYSASSVSGVALQLAVYLGCKKVIFVGQDLSYPNHMIYANHVDHISEDVKSTYIDAKEVVENVQGGMNPTKKALKSTIANIELLIAMYDGKHKFINTSHIGAKIKGTTNIALLNLLDDLKSHSVDQEKFKQLLKDGTSDYDDRNKELIINKVIMIKNRLAGMRQNKISNLMYALEGLRNCLEASNTKNISNILVDIERGWKEITSDEIFDPIIGSFFQASILIYSRFVSTIVHTQDASKKGRLVLKYLGNLVVILYDDIPKIVSMLELSLELIEERIAVSDLPLKG